MNIVEFSKDKGKVLPSGRNNPDSNVGWRLTVQDTVLLRSTWHLDRQQAEHELGCCVAAKATNSVMGSARQQEHSQ